MIRLIKNELAKILKKKSFYIVMLVTLAFIIGFNIIMKNLGNADYNRYYGDIDEQINVVEKELKQLNPLNEEDKETYVDYKASLETYKLIKKYGINSWQFEIVNTEVNPYLRELALYDTMEQKDEKAYQEKLKEYNSIIERLDNNDWRSFVQEDLDDAKQQLEEQNKLKETAKNEEQLLSINKMIRYLEVQKQVQEWRLEKNISYEVGYYNNLLDTYYNASINVIDYEVGGGNSESQLMKQDYYDSLERANKAKYDIENGTKIDEENNIRGMLINFFSNYEIFIVIMIVMIAGTIVSEEFNKGTIKLLLIRPYKRTTILTAKFITCIIMLAIIIITMILMQFIVGGIVFGFESLQIPVVVYNFDTSSIQEIGIANYVLMQTLGKLPIYVLLMTLAFTLSTLFNNSAVAITLTLLGYMSSSTINIIGLQLDLDWIRYFVTPNWDLTQYYFGGFPIYEGTTPIFSTIINIIYFVIMLIPTYIVFKKRNIKNI